MDASLDGYTSEKHNAPVLFVWGGIPLMSRVRVAGVLVIGGEVGLPTV